MRRVFSQLVSNDSTAKQPSADIPWEDFDMCFDTNEIENVQELVEAPVFPEKSQLYNHVRHSSRPLGVRTGAASEVQNVVLQINRCTK